MSKKIYLSPEDRASNVYASTALWNGRTTNEKEQMGRCADYMEIALKRCGFEVINAQYGNMYDRVAESNAWPADLHMAPHTNGFDGTVAGTRVHCYPSEQSRKIGKLIQDRIAPLSPGTSERLVESDNLYELRYTHMPAVLPEFGFHDNPEEAQWLIDNMEAIAEETVQAVCEYFEVPYIAPDKPADPLAPEPIIATCPLEVIRTAVQEIGNLEKNDDSQLDDKTAGTGDGNYTKYARDLDALGVYNGRKQGQPWCDVGVDWAFIHTYGKETGQKLLCQPDNCSGARCDYSAGYYQAAGQWYHTPKIGDQVFISSEQYNYAHTGLVVWVDQEYLYTVEWNTHPQKDAAIPEVEANGGGVWPKRYPLDYRYLKGFGRPAYIAPDVVPEENPVWQYFENMAGSYLYRVQVGAFRIRENAEAYLAKVREIFPDAYIKKERV